jgi:hypothetical protein
MGTAFCPFRCDFHFEGIESRSNTVENARRLMVFIDESDGVIRANPRAPGVAATLVAFHGNGGAVFPAPRQFVDLDGADFTGARAAAAAGTEPLLDEDSAAIGQVDGVFFRASLDAGLRITGYAGDRHHNQAVFTLVYPDPGQLEVDHAFVRQRTIDLAGETASAVFRLDE